ncbi:MAG: VCBS repeat-containing protein [Paludibacteraceae bacterium]|nr:VCBS repeat-containing protein [Paludibacteraceae bacterium]
MGRHFQHDGAMFMMGCAADVLPDSPGLELVCGNQIFSVSSSGVMLMRTIGDKHDGSSQVADFDNDGSPEILVRSSMGRLSMYSVKEGKELFNDEYVMSAHPAIGDIDGDSIPEIVGLVSPSRMAAYKYDPQNSRLVTQWEIAHSDRSAQTSMVIFDFNGDGSGEIVYRDQTSLRIIDGSGRKPQTIANMMVSSATKSEYPVVADIDGDGQAEIVISGTMYRDFKKDNASINIFKSNRWAWAPAPQWWGQY